jgi:hypothetical protein
VGSTTWLKFTRGSVGDKGDGTGRDGVRGMSEKTRGRRGKALKKDKILSKINGEVIEEKCEEERNGRSVECSAAVR